ncbi:glycine, alanine and asparagine-rich protein-like [Gossypium australe]|uniref:Glycine, alanine and asparagine-rich protein-like n=1 Tax=Gossypium australe TaxID=47621 RepID=A0A5B6VZ75_9ROSI|nr:glycine, alanine and asparagine-rich protein-like [Gossypium australe]
MELASDLIDEDSRTWKTDILIPLARSIHDDFQVWGGELSGTFSVRSAYKLLQKSTRIPSNDIIQAENKKFYRKLWNLHIPSKIKITVWKISWNYIPTFANLKLKRLSVPDVDKQRKIVTTFFDSALQRRKLHNQDDQRTSVTIHFDADFDQYSSRSASGLEVRDMRGEILVSKSILHSNVASSFAAEAYTGLQAVRLGISLGINACEIFGDSRTVIKKCQSTERDKSIIGVLIRDIQDAKPFFQEIGFHFTPKTENVLVHVIAKEALKEGVGYYLDNGISEQVRQEMERIRQRRPDR